MFLWLRRAYQVVFFGLFLFLVLVTTAGLIRGYPVHWFLDVDPLVALSTVLATRSLHYHLLWALPLVVLTLVFGRFFCGWICPMGVLHHLLGWVGRKRRKPDRMKQNAARPSRKIKYFILLFMLGAAALGSVQVGLLDPIASTWRAFSTSLIPAFSNSAFGLYQGERHFSFGTFIVIVFAAALVLNFVYPRFYCRVLCPLGALLGLLAKFSLFRISRNAAVCKDCNVCGADCQGAADPQGTVKTSECMVCLNCISGCPRNGLAYRFLPPAETTTNDVELGRRRWITAAVAGVVAVPLARASDGVEPRPDPRRIRPPGALDETEFLERCIKCGACMKVCPTGGLQPALHEAGVEGLWSPLLVPRIGYCEHSCVLCSQVCPTGAIRKLTVAEKVGRPPEKDPVRIGSARFDYGRCLPWAYDTPCIVCEEVCPTSPKAIFFKLETVKKRDGSELTLKRPYVDLSLCTGCGICETRCPVFDRAAILCTSVGETRSPRNRIIMSGGRV
jgi:polyferredoxin